MNKKAAWSSGMIPRLGRGGRGFNSLSGPFGLKSIVFNRANFFNKK